jgi:hypothetical protein
MLEYETLEFLQEVGRVFTKLENASKGGNKHRNWHFENETLTS